VPTRGGGRTVTNDKRRTTGHAYQNKERIMRYGEDYWTPAEVENGLAPHNAVYDPADGVYREVIEDDADDVDMLPSSPLRSERKVRALTAEQVGLTGTKETDDEGV